MTYVLMLCTVCSSFGQQGCPELPLSILDGANSLIVNGINAQDDLGFSVKDAGDVNGDGIADVIIGAPAVDNILEDVGEAYVVFGASGLNIESFDPSTLDGINGFIIRGTSANSQLGKSVDGAGDLNGDGIDDVMIGVPISSGIGKVIVIFGSNSGFSSVYEEADIDESNGIIISSDIERDQFGDALSRIGDINNDGVDDIIIAAPSDDVIFSNSGRSYVIFGNSSISSLDVSVLDGNNGFFINGFAQSSGFGTKVSNAGDVNNDGIDDLILGFPNYDEGVITNVGRICVVYGNDSGFSSSVDLNMLNGGNGFSIVGVEEGATFGFSVGTAEDFNNDGITDLIIGSPRKDYNNGIRNIRDLGEAYVIYGRSSFPSLLTVSDLNGTNSVTIRGDDGFELFSNVTSNNLGYAVDGLSDVNDDGITDIIVSATRGGAANRGGVYIVFGSSAHPDIINADDIFGTVGYQIFEDERFARQRFGHAVSDLGDFNNDGISDFTVGAIRSSSFISENGKAYIFYGGTFDLGDTESPSISCPSNQQLYVNSSLPNYISFLGTANDNCTYEGELTFMQIPPQGTIITSDTDVTISVTDKSGNTNSCSFLVSIKTTSSTIDCSTRSFNVSDLNGENGIVMYGEFAMGRAGGGEDLDVDNAGDINGDGIQDFIIGTTGIDSSFDGPYDNQRITREGSAYIVFGTNMGFPPNINLGLLDGSNGFIIRNDTPFTSQPRTGASVSGAGDLNGDGVDDIMVSDPARKTTLGSELGYTYVIFGQRSGFSREFFISTLDGSNGFTIIGINNFENAGRVIDNLGDINGDGRDDIAIITSGSGSVTGDCYIIYGIDSAETFPAILRVNELNGSNGFTIRGFKEATGSGGTAMAGIGDVNGDAIDDIAISGNLGARRYVIYGGNNIPALVEVSTLDGTNGFAVEFPGRNLSAQVSRAGNINNDGFQDLVVGNEFIVFGGNTIPAVVDLSALDGVNGFVIDDNSIRDCKYAGDFNNDGIDDLVIELFSSVSILYGKNNWDSSVSLLSSSVATTSIRLDLGEGRSIKVSHAGDVNNDNIDDIIIGKYETSFGYDVDAPAPTIFTIFGQDNPDIEPPQITSCPGNQDITSGSSLLNYTGSVTATDDCDSNLEIAQNPEIGTIITANTTVTITVTDNSGKESQCTFEVSVDGADTEDPTASDPDPINVQCSSEVPDPDIEVVTDEADNSGEPPVVAFISDVSDGNSNPEIITRTYSVTDAAGNSINVTQTITINDTTAPTASNPPSIAVECSSDIPAPDISVVTDASDNCGTPTVAFVSDDTFVAGQVTRTYSVTDAAGNSINVTQTITIEDTTAPTASNPPSIAVECSSDIPAPDISVVTDASDNCGTPTVAFVSDDTSVAGQVTRTYSVTDAAGNSINVTQTITIEDTTAPTASNPPSIAVECSSDIPAPDISVVTDASDNCGTPTVAFVSDDTSVAGQVTRTYSVTDAAGNSINVTQTITINDTTAPTASNPPSIAVECSSDIPAPDISVVTDASDNCGTPTVAFVSDDTSVAGQVTRTYSVTDAAGNSINVTQTITIEDTTAPTASNPPSITVECVSDIPAPDISVVTDASDNCGTPTVAFVSDDTSVAGQVIRTYSVTGAAGNSINVTQTITIEDTTAPTASNPPSIIVECESDIPAPDISVVTDASDNCGTPTVAFVSDDTSVAGQVIRTYSITDAAGNSINVVQIIIITDTIAPIINCPQDQILAVGSVIPDYSNLVSVIDNCDTNPVVEQIPVAGTGFVDGMTIQFIVTDTSGNSNSCSMIVSASPDTEAPVIICLSHQVLSCRTTEIPDYSTLVTVTDNIDPDPEIVQVPAPGTEFLEGVEITITATDASGNGSQCSFRLNIDSVTINAGDDEEITEGEEVQLNAETPDSGTVLWSPQAGLTDATIFDPIASPTETTSYTITFISDDGCIAEDTLTVFVEQLPEDETRYGFSPDGDGINEFWEIDGIENYPNNKVSIYNRWGDLVFEINGYNNTSRVFSGTANRKRSLGADNLPEGTYFFNIRTEGANHLKKSTGFLVLKR
ncbi:gliding motility-associated C-terminal domain-containing protein [Aquimarina sp. SS2-1]|uniref:HYR-like domain-containing protein n=1 Tax=Aquimarina besae TaxID=3342247 RepID=UPI00366D4C49